MCEKTMQVINENNLTIASVQAHTIDICDDNNLMIFARKYCHQLLFIYK